jgi:hypothetical protein
MTSNPTFHVPTDDEYELDYKLDDLLARWHTYSQGFRYAKGYAGSDGTCRDYRTPGHFDWKHGIIDEKSERDEMERFDTIIRRVPDEPRRWFTSLAVYARNLMPGLQVWRSQRLPHDAEEREVLLLEARAKLLVQLKVARWVFS